VHPRCGALPHELAVPCLEGGAALQVSVACASCVLPDRDWTDPLARDFYLFFFALEDGLFSLYSFSFLCGLLLGLEVTCDASTRPPVIPKDPCLFRRLACDGTVENGAVWKM